jgi:ppGpp synthetase/RelA/SpoT-type nucleotidyltranferase
MNLPEILAKWNNEKGIYQLFGQEASRILSDCISTAGIKFRISYRIKDNISIAKKLIKKGISLDKYNEMNDRIGLRVVCHYPEHLETVTKLINDNFDIVKQEDKSSLLKINEIGYKSLHYDCRLKDCYDVKINKIIGEIQVRTMCEDVWAELQHNLGYKPLSKIPDNTARLTYCLGGLLEVADQTINNIYKTANETIAVEPLTIANFLENHFINFYPARYDHELSFDTLENLLIPFKQESFKDFSTKIENHISNNNEKIKNLLLSRAAQIELYPFVSQPEFLLITYMMDKYQFDLCNYWPDIYSRESLDKVSTWWGTSLTTILESE